MACCPPWLGIQRLGPSSRLCPAPACRALTSRGPVGTGLSILSACRGCWEGGLVQMTSRSRLTGVGDFPPFCSSALSLQGRCNSCKMQKENNWITITTLVSFCPHHHQSHQDHQRLFLHVFSALSLPLLIWKLRLGAVCPESLPTPLVCPFAEEEAGVHPHTKLPDFPATSGKASGPTLATSEASLCHPGNSRGPITFGAPPQPPIGLRNTCL